MIISGKDDGLKTPMSIEEFSVAVISEETGDNRNELSEKYENLIKQKIVQSSMKTKLEERELEMVKYTETPFLLSSKSFRSSFDLYRFQ